MKIKREHLILIVIFFVGLLIRYYLFKNEVFIGTDAVLYSRLGKNFIEAGNYSFGENYNYGILFPPVYSICVGIINLFINDLFISGKLISLLSSLATIFLFYLLGKDLYSKESGLFAALCYTIYPHIIRTSVSVASESLFLFLLFFSIYLLILSFRINNFSLFLLFGIFSALTYLVRPEGLLLLVFPFLFLKKKNFKKDVLKIFIVLLMFILVASPYLLFLKNSTGKFMLSGKVGVNVLIGEKVTGKDYDKIAWSLNESKNQINSYEKNTQITLISYILQNPTHFIKRYIINILDEVKLLILLLIPIILPLFCLVFSRDLFEKNIIKLIFALFTLLLFITYPLFFISPRFIYPLVLFLIFFSSIGFTQSPSAISHLFTFCKIKENIIALFLKNNIKHLILFVLFMSYLSYAAYHSFNKSEIPIEHVAAGIFLKNLSPGYEELNVMSRKPWVSYYSNSRCTSLPYARSTEVINFARLYDVDYIVIDERLLNKWDVFKDLIQMEKYSDAVELVYEDNSNKLIKLFRLIK